MYGLTHILPTVELTLSTKPTNICGKGETGFVTAIKHAHKFEELFGFAPRGFGTQLYSVGMSKLQLSVVELFTIQCVENASWFHAEITKDVWLNKAAQVVSHLQRKLDKRVGEMSTAVFEA